jgi:hypothetical protein
MGVKLGLSRRAVFEPGLSRCPGAFWMSGRRPGTTFEDSDVKFWQRGLQEQGGLQAHPLPTYNMVKNMPLQKVRKIMYVV